MPDYKNALNPNDKAGPQHALMTPDPGGPDKKASGKPQAGVLTADSGGNTKLKFPTP